MCIQGLGTRAPPDQYGSQSASRDRRHINDVSDDHLLWRLRGKRFPSGNQSIAIDSACTSPLYFYVPRLVPNRLLQIALDLRPPPGKFCEICQYMRTYGQSHRFRCNTEQRAHIKIVHFSRGGLRTIIKSSTSFISLLLLIAQRDPVQTTFICSALFEGFVMIDYSGSVASSASTPIYILQY